MIDTAYDGFLFDVVVADIPGAHVGPGGGSYGVELPPGSSAPVAVKITDMLGEEVLVTLPRPDT